MSQSTQNPGSPDKRAASAKRGTGAQPTREEPASPSQPGQGRTSSRAKRKGNKKSKEEEAAEELAALIESDKPIPQTAPKAQEEKVKGARGRGGVVVTEEMGREELMALLTVATPELPPHRYCMMTLNGDFTFKFNETIVGAAMLVIEDMCAEDPPKSTKLQNRLFPSLINMEHTDLMVVLIRLWNMAYRDYQNLVVTFLRYASVTLLRCAKAEMFFHFLKHLILHRSNHDTVDVLAQKHLGCLLYLYPHDVWQCMDKWSDVDQSPWLRRSAILHQYGLGNFTDKERLFWYCRKEFNSTNAGTELVDEAMEEALQRLTETYTNGRQEVINFIRDNKHLMTKHQKSLLGHMAEKLIKRQREDKKHEQELARKVQRETEAKRQKEAKKKAKEEQLQKEEEERKQRELEKKEREERQQREAERKRQKEEEKRKARQEKKEAEEAALKAAGKQGNEKRP